MLTSYAFSSRISIHSRKAAVDSTFVRPLYRGRVDAVYRLLHVVTLYTFAAFFQRRFYLISAYLAIYIVDLHLYQWPPVLYCRRSTLPAWLRVSAQYYSSSRISYSLSTAYRRRTSSYTFQYLAYLLLYQVALYYSCSLYSSCVYIYVQWQYYCFAFQCSTWCPFIGPCSSIQVLVLQLLQQRQGAFCYQFAVQPFTPDLGAVQHCQSYYCCIQQSCASK